MTNKASCGVRDIDEYLWAGWAFYLQQPPGLRRALDRERVLPVRETIRLYGRALRGDFAE